MTTVIKATDTAELLGSVPALAGFTPHQSIVLLPFQQGRAHGAMRIDPPGEDVDPADYVDTVIGLLTRVSGVDAVAVIVYLDDVPQYTPDGIILPESILIADLIGLAADSGLHIVDALCVLPCGWAGYLDDDPQMTPLDEIPSAPADAGDLTGDQSSGAELPTAGLVEKEHVGRALRDLTAILASDSAPSERTNPQGLAAALLLDDLPLFFESLLENPDTPPYATAALLWCLERPAYRDAALLQWATDLTCGIRALDAQLAFTQSGRSVPDDIGEVLIGRGSTPDRERLRSALNLVREVAARAPRQARPAPLTLAAWMSWALGRSSHAQHYLKLAAEIDPEYSLACLVSSMIDAQVLPEWTFQRGSAM